MRHSDFAIRTEFTLGDKTYRCTDVGTRTIVAIRLDEVAKTRVGAGGLKEHSVLDRETAQAEGWFNGPTYAVVEQVFDENDLPACRPIGYVDGDDIESDIDLSQFKRRLRRFIPNEG